MNTTTNGHLARSFAGLYSKMRNNDAVILTVHTNGLPQKGKPLPSALGISAARFAMLPEQEFERSQLYERFYFPREDYNPEAIARNGLDSATVMQRRQGLSYPDYFEQDLDPFRQFCRGAFTFIGFNIRSFDALFIPGLSISPMVTLFDLMEENQEVVCSEWLDLINGWKPPSFKETLQHYFDTPVRGTRGDTMYKVRMIFEIFAEMRRRSGVPLPEFARLTVANGGGVANG